MPRQLSSTPSFPSLDPGMHRQLSSTPSFPLDPSPAAVPQAEAEVSLRM
ncbi:hypothetical protein [Arthrobacter subterraneus]